MSNVFQSIWTVQECQGPPDSFLLFNISKPPNWYYENPIGICGTDYSPSDNGLGCCISSIDLAATTISSWMNSLEVDVTVNANTQTYCKIQLYNTTLYEYQYYRASGECIYGYRCTLDQLYIYSDLECNSLTEQFPVSNIPVNYTTTLGNASISIQEWQGKEGYIDWTAIIPGSEIVPNNKSVSEICGLVGFILSIIIGVSTILWYGIKLFKAFKVTTAMILGIQILSLVEAIFFILYTYIAFTDDQVFFIFSMVIEGSKFSTFLCNSISCFIIIKLFHFKSKVSTFFMYSILFMIYAAVETVTLLSDIALSYNQVELFSLVSPYASWVQSFYISFNFVFNILPAIVLLSKVLSQRTKMQKKNDEIITISSVLSQNRILITILLLNVIVAGFYLWINYLLVHTKFLGNDRAVLGTNGMFIFLICVQHLLTISLFEYLKIITWELISQDRKSNETPVMLLKKKSMPSSKTQTSQDKTVMMNKK
ncbi:hypothetical protein HDV06_000048 [Boothiomyces sp. JEL0866]|nr:hypothetical protein HDV06_000048 [Boothiomyces sp. JEL0866]